MSIRDIKPLIMSTAIGSSQQFLGSFLTMGKALALLSCLVVAACASSAPTKIGADTYYSSKTNTAGIFGDVGAVVGTLLAEGNQLCTSQGKELELVTQSTTQNVPGVRLGGASITFKCVAKAGNPVMRPDKGVTTIETK